MKKILPSSLLLSAAIVAALFLFSFRTPNDSGSPLWMRYPAISPDGKTIAFTFKGDLYTVPSSGGNASILTLHEAHDFMPVWSPDGKKIAFASDRYGNYDLFVIPSTGGAPERITFHSSDDLPHSFSSDGKNIFFSSRRLDAVANIQFPSGRLPELYSVAVSGGRAKQVLTTPAYNARPDKSGNRIIYEDIKALEDQWRKHHISSFARDIWMYDATSKKHTALSTFGGEDRNPVWSADEKEIYFLSEEQSGSFNIWKFSAADPSKKIQVTSHKNHPVRFLTISGDGTLCYGYNGEIYTRPSNGDSKKLQVTINVDSRQNDRRILSSPGGVTEIAVSPTGKEVAYVIRGEVFVTAAEGNLTKRITNTPETERTISFSPDGKAILYASERNGSWNVYQSKITRSEEPCFYVSTVLKEEALIETDAEEFQPAFSPDGKEVAYLEERTTLKVMNLESKQSRTVLAGDKNYSYIDGDQWYQWSPDSKWLLAEYLDKVRWESEIGLIDASGKSAVVNLSNSGYGDSRPKWMMKGKAVIWFSDMYGKKGHSGRGTEEDVMGVFLTQEAFERFHLSKEEAELLKEKEKKKDDDKRKEGEEKKEGKSDDSKTSDNKAKAPEKQQDKSIKIELKNLEKRIERLTINSSTLSDAVLTSDGETLYYLSRTEDGNVLWSHKFLEKETKEVTKFKGGGRIWLSKDEKYLFVFSQGSISRIEEKSGKKTSVNIKGEIELDEGAERAYLFEHMWRQVKKKFYRTDIHGVDWDFYKKEYAKYLPWINNTRDFSEMACEMLGELNASHTGARYTAPPPSGSDETASLGLFYDDSYAGDGVKIAEVMEGGPLDRLKSQVKAGMIIEKIDGSPITPQTDHYKLLNRKAGEYTLLSLFDPATGKRWDETVKPVSQGNESNLLYERWKKGREKETERLSGGKIGYVHVRGMNDASFREVYSEAMGKHYDKVALIVDTRFNGGGNLHDPLAVFLSGKKYFTFYPRERIIGIEPDSRWANPSIVIQNEGNYSDAHLFPVAYKAFGLGKIVGMPVPGTGTSVWWENLPNGLRFGIPEIGYLDNNGKYQENQQLEPDYKVMNEYDKVASGRDQQLEKAVEVMLEAVKK